VLDIVLGARWATLITMALFGGAMMPLAVMPAWMRNISHVSPVKWGILAMEGAIWRDLSVAELLRPCGILIRLGLAFFAFGILMLRRARL